MVRYESAVAFRAAFGELRDSSESFVGLLRERMLGDACVGVRTACAEAYVEYFNGDEYGPFVESIHRSEANRHDDHTSVCLRAIKRGDSGESTLALVAISAREPRLRQECLEELFRRRGSYEAFGRLLEAVRDERLAIENGEDARLAVETLARWDYRRAEKQLRGGVWPRKINEYVYSYFGPEDARQPEDPDAAMDG